MINYNSLLKHPKWFQMRKIILERDENKCRCCGSEIDLQIHHRQYHISEGTGNFVPPWEYRQKYLITLCSNCHQKGHSQFKVINFKIKKINL